MTILSFTYNTSKIYYCTVHSLSVQNGNYGRGNVSSTSSSYRTFGSNVIRYNFETIFCANRNTPRASMDYHVKCQ